MLALLGWKLLGLMMIPVLLICLLSTWQYSQAMRKERGRPHVLLKTVPESLNAAHAWLISYCEILAPF
jgi:cytochrome oxidase assembly protein ShyY1